MLQHDRNEQRIQITVSNKCTIIIKKLKNLRVTSNFLLSIRALTAADPLVGCWKTLWTCSRAKILVISSEQPISPIKRFNYLKEIIKKTIKFLEKKNVKQLFYKDVLIGKNSRMP